MAKTIGQKELRTDWDALTASDETKAIGHIQNLVAEDGSNVLEKDRVGM